jgi:peptidoglycan/LPS O-acetylase OafA/YrhL
MRFVTAGIPAALLTYGLIELEDYFHKNPIGWIQKLGDSSYSMYLLHPFPIAIAGVLLGKLNISDSPAARAMEWSLWIAVMITTLVTSHLAYLQIETRLNSKGTALVDWTIRKFKEICNQRNTRNI